MTDDDDKTVRLPIRFKAPPKDDDPALRLVYKFDVGKQCGHRNATYLICEQEAFVECGDCGEKLNPIWVLMRLCGEESRYQQNRTVYQAEMARLNERSRTKCQHCGQMTRISRS